MRFVDDRNSRLDRLKMEDKEQWMEWADRIPYLPFKAGWEIKPMPGWFGAMTRFGVRKGEAHVSVYLDVYSRLCGKLPGHPDWPHWEIYPDAEGNNERIAMDDVAELIEKIDASLKAQTRAARKVKVAA